MNNTRVTGWHRGEPLLSAVARHDLADAQMVQLHAYVSTLAEAIAGGRALPSPEVFRASLGLDPEPDFDLTNERHTDPITWVRNGWSIISDDEIPQLLNEGNYRNMRLIQSGRESSCAKEAGIVLLGLRDFLWLWRNRNKLLEMPFVTNPIRPHGNDDGGIILFERTAIIDLSRHVGFLSMYVDQNRWDWGLSPIGNRKSFTAVLDLSQPTV